MTLYKKILFVVPLLMLGAGVALVRHQPSNKIALATNPLTSLEQPVVPIEITGPLSDRESEVSGLGWYGDYLIMLPQYPERVGDRLFALAKSDIVRALHSESAIVLEPISIPFVAPDFGNEIKGFEGFEAIAFKGNQAFLTIEAESDGAARGYVLKGYMADDLSQFTIDDGTIAESPAQSDSPNKADEALVLTKDAVISIYEVNGAQLNAEPSMHSFDFDLVSQPAVSFPTIEYRITDATALDEDDRFWAINYFYSGDRDLIPNRDPLAIRYGRGLTHRQQDSVERLVEFAYGENGIVLTNRAPIQLALTDAGRNWEGIARLEDQGFLIMTDKFPETILGFVTMPETP